MNHELAKRGGRISSILGCERQENERPKDDFFRTPLDVIASFERAEWTWLDPLIWEPFSGDDAISGYLASNGYKMIKTDLNRKTDGEDRIDFLMENKPAALCLVSNPPFIYAHQIIKKAHDLGIQKMALLLKGDFFNSIRSGAVFDFWPPARIHALTWRPDFRNQGAPVMTCSWYVWDRKYEGPTIFAPLHKLSKS
jgi:hypothetical protein